MADSYAHLSLRTKIISVCSVLFFMFCWVFAIQTLRLVNRQTTAALYESAANEQYNLSMSVKTYAENQVDTDNPTADGIMRVIKEYTTYYRNQNSYYYIAEGTGRLVAFTMPQNYMPAVPQFDSATADQQYRLEEIDGRNLIFVSSRIYIFQQEYHIHFVKDITDTLTEQANLAWKISLFLMFILAMLLCFLYLLIRHMFSPFLQLSEQARQIALGNYSMRVTLHSRDETGRLARDFNQMAEAVQRHTGELAKTIQARELFAANLAHELKTPLTSIIGYADLGGRQSYPPEQLQKILAHIKTEGKRIDSLSETLLLWSHTGRTADIEKAICSVASLVAHIKFLLNPVLTQKNQHLQTTTSIDTIYVSDVLFISLLINLCTNASKASPEGAVIRILFDCPTKDMVRIRVKDQGIGIPSDEIEQIMEPFYMVDKQRDRKKGGSGLGLALCKAIVQAHGGSIVIDSALGNGTCVTVLMPSQP